MKLRFRRVDGREGTGCQPFRLEQAPQPNVSVEQDGQSAALLFRSAQRLPVVLQTSRFDKIACNGAPFPH